MLGFVINVEKWSQEVNVDWMKQTYTCIVKLCSHRAWYSVALKSDADIWRWNSCQVKKNFKLNEKWITYPISCDVTFALAFYFRSTWTELYDDDERFECDLRYSSARCRSQYKPKYDTIDLNQCEVQKCLEESYDRLILIIFLNSHNLVLFSFIC